MDVLADTISAASRCMLRRIYVTVASGWQALRSNCDHAQQGRRHCVHRYMMYVSSYLVIVCVINGNKAYRRLTHSRNTTPHAVHTRPNASCKECRPLGH